MLVTTILLILCACNVTPQSTPTIIGGVDIVYPQDGSIIYAEQLFVSGTASDIPGDSFALQLIGPDGSIIGRYPVAMSAGEWQVELPHGYIGEPIEVNIFAVPQNGNLPSDVDYDVATIVLAGQTYRPDGAFGSIVSPTEDSTMGGDTFEVRGTVSGVFENTFTLSLISADNSTIDSKPVTVFNPYFTDEVPWTAELMTNGYTGAAEIRALYFSPADGSEIVLAVVQVTIQEAAG
jgi:hypothetical protein